MFLTSSASPEGNTVSLTVWWPPCVLQLHHAIQISIHNKPTSSDNTDTWRQKDTAWMDWGCIKKGMEKRERKKERKKERACIMSFGQASPSCGELRERHPCHHSRTDQKIALTNHNKVWRGHNSWHQPSLLASQVDPLKAILSAEPAKILTDVESMYIKYNKITTVNNYLTTVRIHIMARTNHLSEEKRQSIITLRTEGDSKTLNVSPSAVKKPSSATMKLAHMRTAPGKEDQE